MRGYISSTGIVACPQPNTCTQRPASIESAITSAARRIFSVCVCSMRSITARVLASHWFAREFVISSLFFPNCVQMIDRSNENAVSNNGGGSEAHLAEVVRGDDLQRR